MPRAPSEFDYRLIVEAVQEGLWVVATDAHTVYVNPRMAQLLGDTAEHLVGASLFEFVTDDWEAVARRMFEQRRPGAAERSRLKLRRHDGTEFWVAMSIQAIAQTAGNAATSALAIVTDVSEQPEREARTQLASVETSAAAAQPAANSAGKRRGRVLVVDDELMMTKVVSRTLNNEHDVVTTTVAEDALKMIAEGQRFDVILCDLMMPRITGMDFHAEVLRSAPQQADRIIFLTGGAFTPRMRNFLEKVENMCIEKPFEPSALRAIINRRVD